MKFTVLSTDCAFNEKQGTTTYKMTVELKAGPINMLDPDIQSIMRQCGFNSVGLADFTGVAHLKPADTWDPKQGYKVASAKCHRKLFDKMTSLNLWIYMHFCNVMTGVDADWAADNLKHPIRGDLGKYVEAYFNEDDYLSSFYDGEESSTKLPE